MPATRIPLYENEIERNLRLAKEYNVTLALALREQRERYQELLVKYTQLDATVKHFMALVGRLS